MIASADHESSHCEEGPVMPVSGTCGLVGNDVHVPVDMAHGMLVDATLDGEDANVLILALPLVCYQVLWLSS